MIIIVPWQDPLLGSPFPTLFAMVDVLHVVCLPGLRLVSFVVHRVRMRHTAPFTDRATVAERFSRPQTTWTATRCRM